MAANAGPAAGARLESSQLARMRRIVDAAVRLAERGGFEAVRLREVAERSGVALGTLYNYFRSKEDLLLFAFNEEIERLERGAAGWVPAGRTPLARVTEFFRRANRGLMRRPQLARAVLRALATGDPETAARITGVELRMQRLIRSALRGEPPPLDQPLDTAPGDARERDVGRTLLHVWFACLLAWSAGLIDEDEVVARVRTGAALMLGRPGAGG